MDKQIAVLENIPMHYENSYHKHKILWVFSFLITLLEVQGFNTNRRKGYYETLALVVCQSDSAIVESKSRHESRR